MTEYIEREAAIHEFKTIGNIFVYGRELCEAIISTIDSVPAADVRPVVKAHWVDNHVAFYRGCPECGAFVRANIDEVFLRDFPSAVGKLNFCPNCGARMEES